MDAEDRRLLVNLNDNIERLVNRISELIEVMGRNTNALASGTKKGNR